MIVCDCLYVGNHPCENFVRVIVGLLGTTRGQGRFMKCKFVYFVSNMRMF